MSEELILWMSQAFGFIALPDRFCTGSSIMFRGLVHPSIDMHPAGHPPAVYRAGDGIGDLQDENAEQGVDSPLSQHDAERGRAEFWVKNPVNP